jgi:hypothetical protein
VPRSSLAAADGDGVHYLAEVQGGLRVHRSTDGLAWEGGSVIDASAKSPDSWCRGVSIFAPGGGAVAVVYSQDAGDHFIPAVALSSDGGVTFQTFPLSAAAAFDVAAGALFHGQLLVAYKLDQAAGLGIELRPFDLSTRTWGSPRAIASIANYDGACPRLAAGPDEVLLAFGWMGIVTFTSTDGASWSQIASPTPATSSYNILGITAAGGTYFFEDGDGMQRYGGSGWAPVVGPQGGAVASPFADGAKLWAVPRQATDVLESDDGGDHWTTHATGGIYETAQESFVIAGGADVVVYTTDFAAGVQSAVSHDGGATFSR